MTSIYCSELSNGYDISLTDGMFKHCCRYSLHTISLEDFQKHKHMVFDLNSNTVNARNDLMKGIKTSRCADCWEKEESGQRSWRQMRNNDDMENTLNFNIQIGDLCNHACFYCHPSLSTTIQKYKSWIDNDNGMITDIEIVKSGNAAKIGLEDIIKYLEQVTDKYQLNLGITGGEPFITDSFFNNFEMIVNAWFSKNEYRKLSFCISTNCNVKVDNLLKFYETATKLKEKHDVEIIIITSIENIEERAEYVRYGLIWDNFIKNFEIHQQYANKHFIRLTVNALSIGNIVNFFKFFSKYNIEQYTYNYTQQHHFRADILDSSFNYYIDQLEEYLIQTNIANKFSEYKNIKDSIKNDKERAKIFKRAITNVDKIRNTNMLTVFPEYKEWFDQI